MVCASNVLRYHVKSALWAYSIVSFHAVCVLWLLGHPMSSWTHGCALMPRMASAQSADPCWCVVCVVVVTSRGACEVFR